MNETILWYCLKVKYLSIHQITKFLFIHKSLKYIARYSMAEQGEKKTKMYMMWSYRGKFNEQHRPIKLFKPSLKSPSASSPLKASKYSPDNNNDCLWIDIKQSQTNQKWDSHKSESRVDLDLISLISAPNLKFVPHSEFNQITQFSLQLNHQSSNNLFKVVAPFFLFKFNPVESDFASTTKFFPKSIDIWPWIGFESAVKSEFLPSFFMQTINQNWTEVDCLVSDKELVLRGSFLFGFRGKLARLF